MSVFPMQPIAPARTGHDATRFVPNRIVQALLDTSTLDMNRLACMDFTPEERQQFAQLIGYSLGGYAELSYVSDESYDTACQMLNGGGEPEARIAVLRQHLADARKATRDLVAALFKNHPSDLEE